jgi:phage terminase large subunit
VTTADLRPEQRAYRPYGAAEKLLYCKDNVVLLSGPAGTGKSRGCLEKLHLCALKYPGMRALMVRNTRSSLTESGLVTYESKVLPVGSPIAGTVQRRMRQAYRYPNGSEVIVGGLDDTTKVMSTEYDLIYIQEAIEVDEGAVEDLTTRLRNGVMPYQQIIGDTNPGAETHWIKSWERDGKLTLLDSLHEDNPTIYDHACGEYTPSGVVYIARLDALSGVRRERLRFGRWVSAEGIIYEGWQRSVHLRPLREIPGIRLIDGQYVIPKEWPRFWVVDFGFTNPFVWQAWAVDPDGRLIRYREIYHTQRLVEDHAKQILEVTKGEPRPQAIICDHDAEDRATLERYLGMGTVPAKKTVSDGIQAFASRLKVQPNNKPRIFLVSDALVERDKSLEEAKKPMCFEEEIESYVWDTSNGRKVKEQPLKENDHGCDAGRYMVAHRDLTIHLTTDDTVHETFWNR